MVMNKKQIYNTIVSLAKHQGYYANLLEAMDAHPENKEEFLSALEEKNFEDQVDLVLYLEA